MRQKLLFGVSAILGVFLAAILGMSLFLDANQFRPTLEGRMTDALGRKVTIGHIRLALLSGGVSVDDISIADDPAFSAAPFLKAKAVTVGVQLLPLIFSKDVRVQSFRLEEPQVVLLRSASGRWNFSGLGTSSTSTAGGSASQAKVSVQKLTIVHGQILVGTPGSPGKNRQYQDVNLDASDLSYTSQFPFRLSAKTPGQGTMSLEGKAGPFDPNDAAATSLEARLELTRLDVASTGFVDPASGMAGLVDLTATLASDGRQVQSNGKLHATQLQLVRGGSPVRVPVEIEYASDYDLKTQTGDVKQGEVHIGNAVAHLTGDYRMDGETPAVQLKLSGQKMPVPELEAILPAIGVTLPSGASLQGGTLDSNLITSGPVDRLVTTGPISLTNAKLTGFDLGAKMGAVVSLTGLPKGSETVIQTLSSTLRVAPEGIRAEDLNVMVPTIGSLTGNGTIASSGAMDFRMLAKLAGSNKIALEASRVASLGHPEDGVRFRIEGTTANPVFVPDVSATVSNVVKNPDAATGGADFVSGLLGRKKRP